MNKVFDGVKFPKGWFLGLILLVGMAAFECSNYFSSFFALSDILGGVGFPLPGMFVRWATVLAIAACLIDFAGIARIFTPEAGNNEPKWVWWLFAVWIAAASADGFLTWWSAKTAILMNPVKPVMLQASPNFVNVIPIAIAGIELFIRVLLIHTFADAFDKLFVEFKKPAPRPILRPATASRPTNTAPKYQPMHKPNFGPVTRISGEPTYHPIGMQSQSDDRQTHRPNGR